MTVDLNKSVFRCDQIDCKEKFTYVDFHKHLLKHNEPEQYVCNRPNCNHEKIYASPSELVE